MKAIFYYCSRSFLPLTFEMFLEIALQIHLLNKSIVYIFLVFLKVSIVT